VNVSNVAPSLASVGNQQVAQTDLLSIADIGKFSDPGFDNLLNAEGETTERFSFAINWGDGTPVDSGPAGILLAGGEGINTAGAFDGSHVFASAGTFTVTVTVSDDDGGSAQATFQVEVGLVNHPDLIRFDLTGGGFGVITPPPAFEATPPPVPSASTERIDYDPYRVASVAGAEPRIVIRVVSPSGVEDKLNEEPLNNGVVDHLRKLFARLPDGHYRIYQIDPDGVERIVVDVFVREGRAIDAADAYEEGAETTTAPKPEITPSEPQATPPDDAVPPTTTKEEGADTSNQRALQAAVLAGAGAAVYSVPKRRRLPVERNAADEPRLTKAQRLLRRARLPRW
jgi:hypothetical protein